MEIKKIGIIGLGKLGFPVAAAIAQTHEVMGTDLNASLMKLSHDHVELGPKNEKPINDWLKSGSVRLSFGSMAEVVDFADIIFVAVQTPHEPEFEGVTPLPAERKDFDYTHLVKCIKDLSVLVYKRPEKVIALISTVLPGTLRQHVLPVIPDIVYNPFFIAMGTVMHDFLFPEFVLIGSQSEAKAKILSNFYNQILRIWSTTSQAPIVRMSIESAELTKVAYNTFISFKIGYINTLMEICHKTGANVDEVSRGICAGTRRLLSPMYLRGGMGDGGGCHPRDNIALSWLAKKLNIKYDIFESLMISREGQAEWFVDMLESARRPNAPRWILGYSFKPGTAITTGSHALLVYNLAKKRGLDVKLWDPYIDGEKPNFDEGVFLIGTKHECFREMVFPAFSTVIDPHRFVSKHVNPQSTIIHVGA